MNKIGLRRAVYVALKKKQPKLTKVQITEILDTVVEVMGDALVDTKRLSIRGFGVLEVAYLKERRGWHPKKQTHIIIPPRSKVKFTPAVKLMERIIG